MRHTRKHRELGRRGENARASRACLRCDREFKPRRVGHVYCSRECRYGPTNPHRKPADPAAIERLFDESRDPSELVRDDDWHPGPPEFQELDACHTLETRRRWYANLRAEGRV